MAGEKERGALIPAAQIEGAILLIRGQKVMIDRDLATLYGVATRVLIQAVKRNLTRFPADFLFQLTWEEADGLRSQFVTLNDSAARQAAPSRRGRHLKYRPFAFTEQGVAMLSSVLRSERAVHVNIEIMRAFVRMRQILAAHADLARKLDALEKRYDAQFKVVFDVIRQLMAPAAEPKRGKIGFAREHEKQLRPIMTTWPIICEILILFALVVPATAGDEEPKPRRYQLARFSAEVTPPIGHPCMGGGIASVQRIDDPLYAIGFVLQGGDRPIVLCAIDWCEIRNDAYERWRLALAEAAGTTRERVLVTCLHQHDAPIADLEAQRLLDQHKAAGKIVDLPFHERAVQRVARALKESLQKPRPISHYGIGQAKVDKVASNRRYLDPDGKPRFNRTSASRDPKIQAAELGTIDPWLKTLSFWDGDQPVLALSCYATHPMSYYGKGGVSADFVGLARKRRQADDAKLTQIYVSGCSGNVTAGKFNDGAPENRPVLADRLERAMAQAWQATQRHPLDKVEFRSAALRLEPRDGPGCTAADLSKRLTTDKRPFGQCLAALGLSWRKRADAGATIDVPALGLGKAHLVLLPAEAYVEYQLMAQAPRPDSFVVVMGYGECAPGYIPHDQAVREGDSNLSDWSWIAPGAEARMRAALEKVLK